MIAASGGIKVGFMFHREKGDQTGKNEQPLNTVLFKDELDSTNWKSIILVISDFVLQYLLWFHQNLNRK